MDKTLQKQLEEIDKIEDKEIRYDLLNRLTNKHFIQGDDDIDYHNGRLNKIDWKYRLRRRTGVIEKAIYKYSSDFIFKDCLDIGTADGLMLSSLNQEFQFKTAVGIDLSSYLLNENKDKDIKLIVGNAEELEFSDNSFDIVISCATIEHLTHPDKMINECYRVLRDDGLLIITTPNPLHDKLSGIIKYSNSDEHSVKLDFDKLSLLLNGFKVLETKYFMFSPFFTMPFEDEIDSFINKIGLGKLLCCNQLIIAKK